ncbi:MAG: hypothetical protein R3314_09670, partial [Longimicrobiales bacterium]|nr:hypothetical protein [Longimicrobiales bacterium]
LEDPARPSAEDATSGPTAAAGGPAPSGLGYTGDTGPSPELGAFMRGLDVLVAECSLPDDQAIDTHLSPASLAALGAHAAPGRLVVTHVYPQLAALDPVARLRAAGWDGEAVRAEDGLELEVT